MRDVAIFPGSFDPFTLGHEDVVRRALQLFDKVVVGIGVNSKKQYLFSEQQRVDFIRDALHDVVDRVDVVAFQGLTVDYCKEHKIKFILRGIRNNRDFLTENEIANMNRTLNPNIETIFFASLPEHSAVNSTIVREILKNGGDVSNFVPVPHKLPKPA